jgi:hypothetical protein
MRRVATPSPHAPILRGHHEHSQGAEFMRRIVPVVALLVRPERTHPVYTNSTDYLLDRLLKSDP